MDGVAPLQEAAFRALVDGKTRVEVIGAEGGFYLLARIAAKKFGLITKKGELRMFTATTAVKYIKEVLGHDRFEVDASAYVEGRLRQPRPDRAEALRGTRSRPQQQPLTFGS